MNDMASVIVPKSDQINADDLIAGPMTITIRDVKITGGQEQPVSIFFDGSEKAFRPCKSMSRVLVSAWGADASLYIGRSLTLYRDAEVKWGGLAVGGIRISHMSNLDGAKTLMLTATKGSRKPHKVMPLVDAPKPVEKTDDSGVDWDAWFGVFKTAIAGQKSERALKAWRAPEGIPDGLLSDARAEIDARIAELSPAVSTGFEDAADQQDDAPDPREALAESILTRTKSVETLIDLKALEKEIELDVSMMPDHMAAAIDTSLDHARARLAKTTEPAGAK